jgi:hypothetical protein
MPIVPAHTAQRSRVPAGEPRATDHGTPGWARPQLAWPFRSVRPPQGANAPVGRPGSVQVVVHHLSARPRKKACCY